MASGFRSNVFDPLLVVAQILALQSCFYLSFGFWLFVADAIGDVHRTLDQIFNYRVSCALTLSLSSYVVYCLVLSMTGSVQILYFNLFNVLQEFEGTVDGWLVMGAAILNSFTRCVIACNKNTVMMYTVIHVHIPPILSTHHVGVRVWRLCYSNAMYIYTAACDCQLMCM